MKKRKENQELKNNSADLNVVYNIKRKNAAKKMAEGGMVSKDIDNELYEEQKRKEQASRNAIKPQNTTRPDKGFGAIIQKAEGGMVEQRPASITAAIMARKRMANGGMVDLEENSEEQANMFDELNEDALSFSDEMLDEEDPMDSNLMGDEEEKMSENIHDRSVVSAIRRKMKLKI